MNSRKVIRYFSAVAAAAVLIALIFEPTRQERVEAATIFRSLRSTEWRGLTLQVDRVRVEGIHLDGQIDLGFNEPVSLSRLMNSEGSASSLSADSLQSVFLDLAVRADETAEADVAGLDLTVRGAYSESDTWVFLQLASLPDQVLEESPEAAIAVVLFGRGVLLDLDSVKGELLNGVFGLELKDEAPGNEPAEADAETSASIELRSDSLRMSASQRNRLHIDLNSEDNADPGKAQELENLLNGFLSGTASTEQLEALARHLEEQAGQVVVEKQADGLYVLRASKLAIDDDEDAELIKNAVLEIVYRSGSGVESLALLHFGAADGTLRLGFNDALVDHGAAARQELSDAGVLPVDVGALIQMFAGQSAETPKP